MITLNENDVKIFAHDSAGSILSTSRSREEFRRIGLLPNGARCCHAL
jgi:hypothetical protein